jgi:hypothetical protein
VIPAPQRAPRTDGLDALDRDRAASLADEGGAAGASIEAEDDDAIPAPSAALLAGVAGVLGIVAAALVWLWMTR